MMDERVKWFLIKFGLSSLTAFLVLSAYLVQHELVHVRIFEMYGIDSEIHYGFLSAEVVPTSSVVSCGDTCIMLQAQAEIVGYSSLPVLAVLILIFVWLVFFRD